MSARIGSVIGRELSQYGSKPNKNDLSVIIIHLGKNPWIIRCDWESAICEFLYPTITYKGQDMTVN